MDSGFFFFFFCYWSQWDHEKCIVSHSLRSASEIPGNVNRVHSSVLFTLCFLFSFYMFLQPSIGKTWSVTCCSFQYTFRAVVERFCYLASVCDQSPTHCLLTDFILTISRSFSLRRRRRVKAGNVTWVTWLIWFILCTTSKWAQYALKLTWNSVCKQFYSCFYYFFPVRSVTSPSVVAPIWRSTWSYIHRTNPSSVPTVTNTSSHDLPGWSTKKNSI